MFLTHLPLLSPSSLPLPLLSPVLPPPSPPPCSRQQSVCIFDVSYNCTMRTYLQSLYGKQPDLHHKLVVEGSYSQAMAVFASVLVHWHERWLPQLWSSPLSNVPCQESCFCKWNRLRLLCFDITNIHLEAAIYNWWYRYHTSTVHLPGYRAGLCLPLVKVLPPKCT